MQHVVIGFSIFTNYVANFFAFLAIWAFIIMIIAGVCISGVKQVDPFEEELQGTP